MKKLILICCFLVLAANLALATQGSKFLVPLSKNNRGMAIKCYPADRPLGSKECYPYFAVVYCVELTVEQGLLLISSGKMKFDEAYMNAENKIAFASGEIWFLKIGVTQCLKSVE